VTIVEEAEATQRLAMYLKGDLGPERDRKYIEHDVIGGCERAFGPVIVEPAQNPRPCVVVDSPVAVRTDTQGQTLTQTRGPADYSK